MVLTKTHLGQYLMKSLLQIGSNGGNGFSPAILRINNTGCVTIGYPEDVSSKKVLPEKELEKKW